MAIAALIVASVALGFSIYTLVRVISVLNGLGNDLGEKHKVTMHLLEEIKMDVEDLETDVMALEDRDRA